MNWSDTLIRCSSIGNLMTEPKDKAAKDAGELSKTAKTHLKNVYIQEKYGREKDIVTRQMQKGIEVEEDSITLLSRVQKKMLYKNEERLYNDYITGLPDIFEGKSIHESDSITDIKSSYDLFTFMSNIGEPLDSSYYYQLQGYMACADLLDPQSPYRFIAEKGLEGASKHDGLLGAIDFNTWVTMSIQRAMANVQSRMQDGLALLATVGSTAPFVGLFGTVWGIYHALVKIGMSGQASIDKVAGPVGEALIMTAIGLAVAVPAVLGYNWLVRRNKLTMEVVHAFGNDLHAVLLATANKA